MQLKDRNLSIGEIDLICKVSVILGAEPSGYCWGSVKEPLKMVSWEDLINDVYQINLEFKMHKFDIYYSASRTNKRNEIKIIYDLLTYLGYKTQTPEEL
jgi:hypothetical protein